MTNEAFDDRLREINKIVEELPPDSREKLRKLIQETRERQDGIRKSVQAARAAVADLRIRCKYLIFDAEACCRESQMDHDQRTDGPLS